MENKNNKKKSLKDRVIEHKGTIIKIAGGTLVVAGSLAACKHLEIIKRIIEEGALDHAVDSVNRKITYRENKIKNIIEFVPNYQSDENYIKYAKELKELYGDQKIFIKLKNKIKIKEL